MQEIYNARYEKRLCIYCGINHYTSKRKTCEACRTRKIFEKFV